MFAIIETGGKQYKVKEGDLVNIEKVDKPNGETIDFNKVLMIGTDDKIEVGNPFIKNAKVTAELLRQDKTKKVVAFKFKRRKSSRKKIGHRQQISLVKIEGINF